MQINSLEKLLSGLDLTTPRTQALPAVKATPPAQKAKIVSRPVVAPVNKQAAMVVRPNRCWLSQPAPDKIKTVTPKEFEEVKAKLKIERNSHALTRADLGNCRGELRHLREAITAMGEKLERLATESRQKDETIRQLEDLKL